MQLNIENKNHRLLIGAKLRKLREKLRLSCKDFAARLGRTRSYISGVENGHYPLSPKLIKRIETIFGIDAYALLADVSFVGNEEEASETNIKQASASADCTDDGESIRRIPIIGETEAGLPSLICDAEIVVPNRNFETVAITNFHSEKLFALRVRGYSMAPRVLPGDIAVLSQNRKPASNTMCVAVNIENESTLKIYEEAESCVVLRPINPEFRVLVLKKEEILRIYPVIAIFASPVFS